MVMEGKGTCIATSEAKYIGKFVIQGVVMIKARKKAAKAGNLGILGKVVKVRAVQRSKLKPKRLKKPEKSWRPKA